MNAIGRFFAKLVKRTLLMAVLTVMASAMVIVLDAMLLERGKREDVIGG